MLCLGWTWKSRRYSLTHRVAWALGDPASLPQPSPFSAGDAGDLNSSGAGLTQLCRGLWAQELRRTTRSKAAFCMDWIYNEAEELQACGQLLCVAVMAERSQVSSGGGVAEPVGAAWVSLGSEEVVCFCLLGARCRADCWFSHYVMSTLACPHGLLESVWSESAPNCLCLPVCTYLSHFWVLLYKQAADKRRGSWRGELTPGVCYCPCRWEAGLGQGAYGARRLENSVPWGVKGF